MYKIKIKCSRWEKKINKKSQLQNLSLKCQILLTKTQKWETEEKAKSKNILALPGNEAKANKKRIFCL